jgi:hypothetical protein
LLVAFNDPEFAKQEFEFAKPYTPLCKKCWEEDFVKLVLILLTSFEWAFSGCLVSLGTRIISQCSIPDGGGARNSAMVGECRQLFENQ